MRSNFLFGNICQRCFRLNGTRNWFRHFHQRQFQNLIDFRNRMNFEFAQDIFWNISQVLLVFGRNDGLDEIVSCNLIFYLNPASVAFAKDTRHQARSRIFILQALYNAVDLVKEAFPKGLVFPK